MPFICIWYVLYYKSTLAMSKPFIVSPISTRQVFRQYFTTDHDWTHSSEWSIISHSSMHYATFKKKRTTRWLSQYNHHSIECITGGSMFDFYIVQTSFCMMGNRAGASVVNWLGHEPENLRASSDEFKNAWSNIYTPTCFSLSGVLFKKTEKNSLPSCTLLCAKNGRKWTA